LVRIDELQSEFVACRESGNEANECFAVRGDVADHQIREGEEREFFRPAVQLPFLIQSVHAVLIFSLNW